MSETVIVNEWKRFRRYNDGAEYYGISQSQFERMAREAGALIKRNRLVLVDCELFEEYLLQFRVGE